jgi:hypothetical protein
MNHEDRLGLLLVIAAALLRVCEFLRFQAEAG